MAATANKFVEDLEKVWSDLNWDRKFEHSNPSEDIIYVWRAYSKEEVLEAAKVLLNFAEEEELEDGTFIVRSAHLGNWSSGEAIVICESKLD